MFYDLSPKEYFQGKAIFSYFWYIFLYRQFSIVQSPWALELDGLE